MTPLDIKMNSVLLLGGLIRTVRRLDVDGASTDGRVPVLCYHHYMPKCPDGEKAGKFNVTPRQFARHMELLRKLGFETLSLDEYRAIADGRTAPPRRSVLITIDDGYADNLRIAMPIARKFGAKLNIFVVTSFADNPLGEIGNRDRLGRNWKSFKRLDWGEVRRMRDMGAGIGLHGYNHEMVSAMDRGTPGRFRRLTSVALDTFENELGFRPLDYAFPFGCPGSFNDQSLRDLEALGVKRVFSTLSGRLRLPSAFTPIPRLTMREMDTEDLLRMKLFGAWDWVGVAKKTMYALGLLERR